MPLTKISELDKYKLTICNIYLLCRHEVMDHDLKVEVYLEDERDQFGYYFCQSSQCGLVFSTKQTRNRYI